MEKIKNAKLNLIEIILIISPIIDVLTSFSERSLNISISFGLVFRAGILGFLIIYTLLKSNWKYKKISIVYYIIIAGYFVVHMFNMYVNKGEETLYFELKEMLKAFFFPIATVGLLNYMKTKEITVSPKILFAVVLEYITLLFIPTIFHLEYESYAQDKIGSIGWFFSGNEISNIFAILIPFIVFSYDYIENKLIYIGIIIYSLFTIMMIGTKIPAISGFLVIFTFIIFKFIRYKIHKKKVDTKFIITSVVLLMSFIIIFITSPVFKNYDIYKNYLISTRNNQIQENELIDLDDNKLDENEVSAKPNTVNGEITNIVEDSKNLTNSEIETIIHSGRIETKNTIRDKFNKSEKKVKLTGLGKLDLEDESQNLSEIDYYDILYNYGYIGFLIYFIPIIAVAIFCIKKINLTKLKEIINDNEACVFIISAIMRNRIMCNCRTHICITCC